MDRRVKGCERCDALEREAQAILRAKNIIQEQWLRHMEELRKANRALNRHARGRGRRAEERAFHLAAKSYAFLMTRDHRNSHRPEDVGREIDRARGRFYGTYIELMDARRKSAQESAARRANRRRDDVGAGNLVARPENVNS